MKLSRYQKEVVKHMAAGAVIVHDWLIVNSIISGYYACGPWDFEESAEGTWCKKPNESTVKALMKKGLIKLDSRRHCSVVPPGAKERERYDTYKLTEAGKQAARAV